MTLSKPIIRMCVITRNRKERSQLVKITRSDNKWQINNDNHLEGRSLYLDLTAKDVIKKFIKQQRRFKIEDANMQELVEILTRLNEEQNAENI